MEWIDSLLVNPPVVEDGFVGLTNEPGFGIELNKSVVADHAYSEKKVHTIDHFEKDREKHEVGRR